VLQHDDRALANHLTNQEVNPMLTVVLIVALVCVAAIAIVGWLLSPDPPIVSAVITS